LSASKVMNKLARWFLSITAALVILVDQVSKYIIVNSLERFQEWAPIPSLQRFFAITYITNTGVAFGLFPDSSILFIIIAVVVIAIIFVYHRQLAEQQWLLRISLGLQLGGAIGNLLDRLTRGYVVDFIHFKFWPVFNVADSCVVVGAALMAYFLLKEGQVEEAKETSAEGEEENVSVTS